MTKNAQLARLAIESLSHKDRQALLAELVPNHAERLTGPKVYPPSRVAELFGGRSRRWVFKLAHEGLLDPVVLPGRTRSIGFTSDSVERLLHAMPGNVDVRV